MNEKTKNVMHGSGKPVDDFSTFCEGDIDPPLNKKINTIIGAGDEYLIYLDDNYFVQWTWTDSKQTPGGFGAVVNRLGHLETVSRTQLRESQYYHFERMLAESMARLVGDEDEKKANELLDKSEAYLQVRGAENARIWYVFGSSVTSIPFIILVCIFEVFHSSITQYFGVDAFEVLFGTFIGGLGAFFFVLACSEKITMNPAAGSFVHYVESASRIVAGSLGALLMSLAVKANILLGIIKTSEYSLTILLFLCFCAGASERLVSGLIKKIEDTATNSN